MKIGNYQDVEVMYDSLLVKFPKADAEKKEESYTKTDGGIYVVKTEDEKKKKKDLNSFVLGEVIRAGFGYVNSHDEATMVPLKVKEGDFVIIDSRNSANNVIVESDDEFEYRLIREQNILMKSAKKETFIFDKDGE